MKTILLLLSLSLVGCALADTQSRKITAWGIWCTAAACGIGYWHSERGPGEQIKSEESAPPGMPGPFIPWAENTPRLPDFPWLHAPQFNIPYYHPGSPADLIIQ